jgi:hypothetical protein
MQKGMQAKTFALRALVRNIDTLQYRKHVKKAATSKASENV